MMFETPLFAFIFLLGSSLATGISSAIQRIGKAQAETIAKRQKGLATLFFAQSRRDLLTYILPIVKHIYLFFFSIFGFDYGSKFLSRNPTAGEYFLLSGILLGIFLISDILFRIFSLVRPKAFFKSTCQIISLYTLPIYPFALLLFRGYCFLVPSSKEASSLRIKDKILEILHDAEFAPYLEVNDQQLIVSVVSFKERIAREIMVPRIDMYTLSSNTSVREAVKAFSEEEYSRIPVWKESVDQIIGTLHYKDLLKIYDSSAKLENELDSPIENLLKPILYTPETKKISQLLQEFRSKQIHLAIVVDEYGGTEGIVTIEDILEELVGEIADEYDSDEEALFTPLPSGGWIVDAKMSILDIEDELGVRVPSSPEYDTIGGYIFHKTGTIPKKGWSLHQNDFDLEILSSSDRSIEKIRITPL